MSRIEIEKAIRENWLWLHRISDASLSNDENYELNLRQQFPNENLGVLWNVWTQVHADMKLDEEINHYREEAHKFGLTLTEYLLFRIVKYK